MGRCAGREGQGRDHCADWGPGSSRSFSCGARGPAPRPAPARAPRGPPSANLSANGAGDYLRGRLVLCVPRAGPELQAPGIQTVFGEGAAGAAGN